MSQSCVAVTTFLLKWFCRLCKIVSVCSICFCNQQLHVLLLLLACYNQQAFIFCPFQEHLIPPAAEVTLQGPIALALRTECLRDEKILTMMGLDPVKFPLLNPSRMGKSAVDDLAVSVIQNLLEWVFVCLNIFSIIPVNQLSTFMG